jgi:hypothetical protein
MCFSVKEYIYLGGKNIRSIPQKDYATVGHLKISFTPNLNLKSGWSAFTKAFPNILYSQGG